MSCCAYRYDAAAYLRIAICEDPSHPSSGYVLPYTNTSEGARLEVVCLTEINGLQREIITTVVCTHEGNWDPNPKYACRSSLATLSATDTGMFIMHSRDS